MTESDWGRVQAGLWRGGLALAMAGVVAAAVGTPLVGGRAGAAVLVAAMASAVVGCWMGGASIWAFHRRLRARDGRADTPEEEDYGEVDRE